ncbi:MAG: Crp/Fnr family transcriptional regulator [Candidatus Kapabacteria bacterium]|nr:Crp/Fnr family transcriptional regulator [Candidatus Kapabacteria bacterium]
MDTVQHYQKLFQQIEHIVPISAFEKERIMKYSSLQFFPKKSLVQQQDSVVFHEYFLLKGCMRTYHTDQNGNEHNLFFATEHWWAGDLESFTRQTPSSFTVQALEDTTVIAISHSDIQILYNEIPQLERFFRILIQNAFVSLQRRIINNLSQTALERYKQFRTMYPNIEQRISQKHIASYLGITPEFLSLLRSKHD